MNKPVDLNDIQPDVVYYTDAIKDCEVTLNRVHNNTIFFNVLTENKGGYLIEDDGTLAFPLSEQVFFFEK